MKTDAIIKQVLKTIGGIENFPEYSDRFSNLPGNEQKLFLDLVWSYLVKVRAGFRDEITEATKDDVFLNSHHILGKPNLRLRWELKNGICIAQGLHHFGAHGTKTRQLQFERKVRELRGNDIYDKLLLLKNGKTPSKYGVLIYFIEEYKRY